LRRVVLSFVLFPAAAACALLVDDLSTEREIDPGLGWSEPDATAAERGRDAAEVPSPREDPDPPPIVEPLDAGAPLVADADAEAPFVLDCTGAILCDGFEDRTTARIGEAPIGGWIDNQTAGGTAQIMVGNAAAGGGYVDFVSPANPTTASKFLLLGNNQLAFSNNTAPTVIADFDVHIHKYTELGPGDRRNFVGFQPYSDNGDTNQEFAGISISSANGLHAELREYASALATVRKDDRFARFPLSTLTGRWHRVHVEAKFARDATGSMIVDVDGVNVAAIRDVVSRTNRSHAPKFVFWIGNNAGAQTPELSIRYDNVVIRTR
jgi:hypothetical protein